MTVIQFPRDEYRAVFNRPRPDKPGEIVSLGIYRSMLTKRQARRARKRLRLINGNGPSHEGHSDPR